MRLRRIIILDVLDEGRDGSILTVYGVFFTGEKSKLMCQTTFSHQRDVI